MMVTVLLWVTTGLLTAISAMAHVTYLTCVEETSMHYMLHSASSSNHVVMGSSTQLVHHSHLLHRPLWMHEPHALGEGSDGGEGGVCNVAELPCTAGMCLKRRLPHCPSIQREASQEEQQEASKQLWAAATTSSSGEEGGGCPGLRTGFWNGTAAGNGSVATGGFAVTFPDRPADLVRHDYPNHTEALQAWHNPLPTLPGQKEVQWRDNFAVHMEGQVLIEEAQDVELQLMHASNSVHAINASMFKLVCLQHDDSASLTMEGVFLSAAGSSAPAASLSTAKVVCAEALLPAGWHNITIQYASEAGQSRHHLRMSLHNPLLVEERYPGRFIIHYENAGLLCPPASKSPARDACAPPVPLLHFRSPCSHIDSPMHAPAHLIAPQATSIAAADACSAASGSSRTGCTQPTNNGNTDSPSRRNSRSSRRGRSSTSNNTTNHAPTTPSSNGADAGGWHYSGSLAQSPAATAAAASPHTPQTATPNSPSTSATTGDKNSGERLPYAPDLPSAFPCYPKGGFRQSMGVKSVGQNAESASSASILEVDFSCNSTQNLPKRTLLEEGLIPHLVCCYEEGKQRPADGGCSQGTLSCSPWNFEGPGQPRVECTASESGPVGADVHIPGAANFTATAPKLTLPTPLHSLHVDANATAQWAVMVSSGQGMTASFTQTASTVHKLCRKPTCELFAVDAAYSSDSPVGLATDRSSAHFTLACTHDVLICEHCVTVLGPTSSRIAQFAAAGMRSGEGGQGGASGASCSAPEKLKSRVYEGKVVWEEKYRGVVRISLESAREEGLCEYVAPSGNCTHAGEASRVGEIPELRIQVRDYVPFKAEAATLQLGVNSSDACPSA